MNNTSSKARFILHEIKRILKFSLNLDFTKPFVFLTTFLFYASFTIIDSNAQAYRNRDHADEIVHYKNSNAANYAIASAMESKKAYQQCKAIFLGIYINRYYRLSARAHVDTAYQFLLKAIEYNKLAYKYNKDTLNLGADYLFRSEQMLLQAQTYLYGILSARKDKDIHYYGETAMYYFGHGAVDAYRASMHLADGTKTFNEIPINRETRNYNNESQNSGDYNQNYQHQSKDNKRYRAKPLFGDDINLNKTEEDDDSSDIDEIQTQTLPKKTQYDHTSKTEKPRETVEENKPSNSQETISLDQLEKLLNNSETEAKKFLESVESDKSDSDEDFSRNISRLESDEAVFSALKYSYEQQIEKSTQQIEKLEEDLKNAKSSKEKRKIQKELENEQAKLKDLKEKFSNADAQLADIQKELTTRRKSIKKGHNFPTYNEVASKIDYPLNPDLPQGLVYKVQIGYYPWKKNPLFKGGKMEHESQVIAQLDGWNLRYLTGEFKTYNDAADRRDEIQKKYVTDAFVVAFYNGKKINMYEAQSIENKD